MSESIFKRELPELEKQFDEFAKKSLEEGALSAKVKELIAAALSVAVKCEPCLEHHLKQSLGKGASVREIAEALGVALLMVGGPASAWPMKTVDKILQNVGNKLKTN
jgi:AhpD family alkylhydroperoxidase